MGPQGADTMSFLGPDEIPFAGKTVIICLGNRYMGDDGIGVRVADELERRHLGPNVTVDTHRFLDFSILWQYRGASRIIFVDALESGSAPGTVAKYSVAPNRGPPKSPASMHGLKLHDLLDIAHETGTLVCPVSIVGIEPKECRVGEGLSAELAAALPEALEVVIAEAMRA